MPISSADAAHLLRRAGFGGTATEVANLATLTRAQAVAKVLDMSAAPADVPPSTIGSSATSDYQQWIDLVRWQFDRCATTTTPLSEKMTLFWSNHFVSAFNKVGDASFIYRQNAFYRANAFGDFRLLAQGMAVQPAMLDYLDNRYSTKWGPNQNFARELMELFLLGVGNYSEDDVVAAAAAWTGHSIDAADNYVFKPTQHDTEARRFLDRTAVWDGPQIIDEILTTRRSTVARFIVGKLWTFFAYPNPQDAIVTALADIFIANNLNIRKLVEAMFLRDEFYSDQAMNGLVRTPIEFIVAIMRAVGLNAAELHPEWFAGDLGQEPFSPPDVSGWKWNEYWISTNFAAAKANFAQFVSWRLADQTPPIELFPNARAMTPAELVARLEQLFSVTLKTVTRNAVTNWVLRQRAQGNDWWEPVNLTVLSMLVPELQMA